MNEKVEDLTSSKLTSVLKLIKSYNTRAACHRDMKCHLHYVVKVLWNCNSDIKEGCKTLTILKYLSQHIS